MVNNGLTICALANHAFNFSHSIDFDQGCKRGCNLKKLKKQLGNLKDKRPYLIINILLQKHLNVK